MRRTGHAERPRVQARHWAARRWGRRPPRGQRRAGLSSRCMTSGGGARTTPAARRRPGPACGCAELLLPLGLGLRKPELLPPTPRGANTTRRMRALPGHPRRPAALAVVLTCVRAR